MTDNRWSMIDDRLMNIMNMMTTMTMMMMVMLLQLVLLLMMMLLMIMLLLMMVVIMLMMKMKTMTWWWLMILQFLNPIQNQPQKLNSDFRSWFGDLAFKRPETHWDRIVSPLFEFSSSSTCVFVSELSLWFLRHSFAGYHGCLHLTANCKCMRTNERNNSKDI